MTVFSNTGLKALFHFYFSICMIATWYQGVLKAVRLLS